MLATEKQRQGLRAINAVLVLARTMAYESRSGDLAVVLDVAEYLPMLILEVEDRTEEFREQLVDLAKRFPRFAIALERFEEVSG